MVWPTKKDRQIDRQKDRQIDRQKDRQKDRHYFVLQFLYDDAQNIKDGLRGLFVHLPLFWKSDRDFTLKVYTEENTHTHTV